MKKCVRWIIVISFFPVAGCVTTSISYTDRYGNEWGAAYDGKSITLSADQSYRK